jgi:hypothetical protein
MTSKYQNCVLCVLFPVALSGAFGYLAGSVAEQMGVPLELAHALAGLVGFMGAQAFNFMCILLSTRYHRRKIRLNRLKERCDE